MRKIHFSGWYFGNFFSIELFHSVYKGSMWLTGHDTGTEGKEKYRPAYLDHFEKKEQDKVAPPRAQPQMAPPIKHVTPPHHSQRSFIDGDFDFVSILIYVIAEKWRNNTWYLYYMYVYMWCINSLYVVFWGTQVIQS